MKFICVIFLFICFQVTTEAFKFPQLFTLPDARTVGKKDNNKDCFKNKTVHYLLDSRFRKTKIQLHISKEFDYIVVNNPYWTRRTYKIGNFESKSKTRYNYDSRYGFSVAHKDQYLFSEWKRIDKETLCSLKLKQAYRSYWPYYPFSCTYFESSHKGWKLWFEPVYENLLYPVPSLQRVTQTLSKTVMNNLNLKQDKVYLMLKLHHRIYDFVNLNISISLFGNEIVNYHLVRPTVKQYNESFALFHSHTPFTFRYLKLDMSERIGNLRVVGNQFQINVIDSTDYSDISKFKIKPLWEISIDSVYLKTKKLINQCDESSTFTKSKSTQIANIYSRDVINRCITTPGCVIVPALALLILFLLIILCIAGWVSQCYHCNKNRKNKKSKKHDPEIPPTSKESNYMPLQVIIQNHPQTHQPYIYHQNDDGTPEENGVFIPPVD